MRIDLKPLSVNKAWKGRRFRTDEYKNWKTSLLVLLPRSKKEYKGNLELNVVFGFSSKGSDIDNPLKPLIDTLQEKYSFNDNQIQRLVVEKEIVKKGNEFIKINIIEL